MMSPQDLSNKMLATETNTFNAPKLEPLQTHENEEIDDSNETNQYVFSPVEEFDAVNDDSPTTEISNDVKEDGPYRIVDISYLLQQTVTLQSDHNKLCADGQLQYIKENRHGLSSSFIYKCNNCDMEKIIYTENVENESKLNTAAVCGTISNGNTYADLCQFLNILDIPSISSELYCDIEAPFITENSNSPNTSDTDQKNDDFLMLCDRSEKMIEHQELKNEFPVAIIIKEECNENDSFQEELSEVDNDINKQIEFPCDICEKVFKLETAFLKHLGRHSGVEKTSPCDICGKVYETSNMLMHRKNHHGINTCPYCDHTPANLTEYNFHMEKLHSDKKSVECLECSKKYFTKELLKSHMILHSGKCHICEICGLKVTSSSNLKLHMLVHMGHKDYSCSQCDMKFTTSIALNRHLRKHLDERPYICSMCGATFNRADTLQRHLSSSIHFNDRPFKCDYCDKSFISMAKKKRHHVTHTETRDYKCEVCEKEFNRQSNLRVHMRIHTGEKPHVCEHCGKGFIYAHVLRTHLLTHEK